MTVMIDASAMRHRIALKKAVQQADLSQPFGAAAAPAGPDNSPYANVWAEIQSLQGKDLYHAQQFVSDVTHMVTIRYIDGVSGGDLVLFKGRKFRVMYPLNPEERNIRLDLLCSEINEGVVAAT